MASAWNKDFPKPDVQKHESRPYSGPDFNFYPEIFEFGRTEAIMNDGRPVVVDDWYYRESQGLRTCSYSRRGTEKWSNADHYSYLESNGLLEGKTFPEKDFPVEPKTDSSGNDIWEITVTMGSPEDCNWGAVPEGEKADNEAGIVYKNTWMEKHGWAWMPDPLREKYEKYKSLKEHGYWTEDREDKDADGRINARYSVHVYPQGQEIKHGDFKSWYKTLEMETESEGKYKDGKREGKWTFWHTNGKIKSKVTYKDGEIMGTEP